MGHVAPPRGERGLKYDFSIFHALLGFVAPPRGERGLKFFVLRRLFAADVVAPPRGERGLKSLPCISGHRPRLSSLPLVGSVD